MKKLTVQRIDSKVSLKALTLSTNSTSNNESNAGLRCYQFRVMCRMSNCSKPDPRRNRVTNKSIKLQNHTEKRIWPHNTKE